MDAETLLRLILIRFKTQRSNSASPDSQEEPFKPAKTSYCENELCDFFVTLWVKQLEHCITLDAALRDVLCFLLPSQWSGAPCDSFYLKEAVVGSNEKNDLQYLEEHSDMQQVFTSKEANKIPFFLLLDQLVALLQPKLPQLSLTLKEWMAALDGVLLSLRAFFVTLQTAFLKSFCLTDKQLTEAHHNIPWEEMRQMYCIAVCDLCRLLDAQLFAIVTRTMATQLDGACACLKTHLFTKPASQSPEEVSDAVANLVAKRLDSVAAYIAGSSPFGRRYPGEVQRTRLSRTLVAASIDDVRGSCCFYVAKLEAVTTNEKELPCKGESADDTQLEVKTSSVKNTQDVGMLSVSTASVSLDQAYSLVALPENDSLASRVAAIAPPEDDTLLMMEHLLATQTQKEAKTLHEAVRISLSSKRSPKASVLSARSSVEVQEPSAQVAVTAAAAGSSILRPSASPLKLKSNHKETVVFWTRLQRKLGLDDVAIQRISERCKFENESPYSGVFLVDLDIRNNDRATMSFVESLRQLIPRGASTEMSSKNMRLFKEAFEGYAKELLDKSKELQNALPFLPIRTNGVLLGSLYAVLRADKQFQSLKQIYQQASHLPASSERKVADQALLANVETLIVKRIHFFSKLAASDDMFAKPPSQVVADGASESHRRRSRRSTSKEAPPQAVVLVPVVRTWSQSSQRQLARSRSSSSTSTPRHQSFSERAKRSSSVTEAFSEAQRSVSRSEMPVPSAGTRVEEVYQHACRFYGVTENSALVRQLKQAKENYITTLDLSSNYVGVKGLKPVLALLNFNGSHLISLSLCNNNFENEEVEQISRMLEGPAGENLVYLDLSFNPISSLALVTLQKLSKQLPRLESLLLRATLLPYGAVKELQQNVLNKTAQRLF
ncbi:hypothetical protein ABB37_05988 [Leptomonas pyrrhocoris]|uniref:Leucine-rich repeat protein n=1 Tax=Leptomonas pyrrhocoris TaxID=157538 RepID=A0A0N0VEU6_LEPPY|nr:hypothetical protein ABB37_05988 [Leptomonas pyrrhocoris]KPA78924.1 hypothetical protein ABB37_05988 [Leptomonas pyrrhocoris]|eukprot:XP_015657363.1 hypothetical protein ABB37_05988 [Leptomonas pyrrhocoris]